MGNPGCSVACQSQEPQWGRRRGVRLAGTHPPLHAPTHALSSSHSPQSPLQPSSQTSAGITVRPQLLPCTTAPIPTAAQLPAQIILHTPRGAQLPPTVHTQLFSMFSPPPLIFSSPLFPQVHSDPHHSLCVCSHPSAHRCRALSIPQSPPVCSHSSESHPHCGPKKTVQVLGKKNQNNYL